MKCRALGSTQIGHQLTVEEALLIAGYSANVCYMKADIDAILKEPKEKTLARAMATIRNKHHSVTEHAKVWLAFEGIPKILAMVLNSLGVYATSEKSARYTEMHPSPKEQELYDWWKEEFEKQISAKYYDRFYNYQYKKIINGGAKKKDGTPLTEEEIKEKVEKETDAQIVKLAQENARYMISVFTETTMVYSVDIRQLNYILYWFKDFIENAEDTKFNLRLKKAMREFCDSLKEYEIENLNTKGRSAGIILFDDRVNRKEQWGESYTTVYLASFASLAQAHRHRTIRYNMRFTERNMFYIPKIIEDDTVLKEKWLKDITSVADEFPQGMLVRVCERGTYEDFMKKCEERLCGCAQLETALQTKKTIHRYLNATKDTDPEVYKKLSLYGENARCAFNGGKCPNEYPCVWGAKDAFARLI